MFYRAYLAGGAKGIQQLTYVVRGMMCVQTADVLSSMLCVAVQRRHLMVWAIFAPKFIMDCALHAVHMTVGLVVFFLFTRKHAEPKEKAS